MNLFRFIRLPYYYLPNTCVKSIYKSSIFCLRVIRDVHHNIPNSFSTLDEIKWFMYHPAFIRWTYAKSKTELVARGFKDDFFGGFPRGYELGVVLDDNIISLKSRSLADFVPPTDAELAEDIVWLFGTWSNRQLTGRRSPIAGGRLLPRNYVALAEMYYGYAPSETDRQRIDEDTSWYHRDSDAGWYSPASVEEEQIIAYPLGQADWRRRND